MRPVRFVVPFAPGGPVEPPARLIAEHLTARLGQPVVVELKPGAAGAIGAREVAGATDGHSFLFTTGGLAVLPALQRDPGLDVLRDLAPVTVVADMPMAIVVRADSPIADLPGLVAAARARPGGLAYGSSGSGSTTHLAWLLLQARTGLELLHVPYRGAGMAVNALYAGEIGVYMGDLGLLLPHVADGRFRMLAVTSAARLPLLPGAPAVAEAGRLGAGAARRGEWRGAAAGRPGAAGREAAGGDGAVGRGAGARGDQAGVAAARGTIASRWAIASSGSRAVRAPAAASAASLAAADSRAPPTSAPAWPIRRSGGAWRPTSMATTGLPQRGMASASAYSLSPPISPQ